ncbi:MAG: DUF2840 domain-containing protein [Mesorhizobium sp.]|uniref:DUF2840 domain-containing protein n=1 Tax=Mesorhizobium sp. TaxID=1871066 RepID=UPI000FE40A52|nr:DUF2840 domain-containing protein [Mesorhizobium sp.]RWK23466.1 MAG: DUF2840 domain-containing protein [Mesorhizobium sp.]RWK30945.1 MAG: DUF2840 domain-containing protein [Mesorhizobium sp.]TIQ42621.1 MAG: DUF2840 domain-containing protein [Mesorhizobium sp.]
MGTVVDFRSSRLAPGAIAGEGLTNVELTWVEKKIEYWIRFGSVARKKILDRRRRIVSFRPGDIFAFVRWAANGSDTIICRVDIVRAVTEGEAHQTLPFVRPGGDILLTAQGWPKVERVLQTIDGIEQLGIDPGAVSPDHWRHVHNRMMVGQAPRTYTLDLHRAYLLRRRVQP